MMAQRPGLISSLQLQDWMFHEQEHFIPTTYFHLFSCCYTLIMYHDFFLKNLEVSFEVQLLFFTAIYKLQ